MSNKRTILRAANLLDKAAALIEEKGWIKGQYYDGQGYCPVGALRVAARQRRSVPYLIALEAAEREVRGSIPRVPLARFNDSQSVSRPVLALLRRAARKLRESVT